MRKLFAVTILIILISMSSKVFASSLPPVVADGAILIDANSGKILYEKNKNEVFNQASTTKIMTALLVLENCKLDDKVIVGKIPSSFVDGSKIYIFENEEFTVDQLLHALLIESANDVAIALAEHVSGTEEAFAKLMTKRAKELGCLNTNFANSHGLYDKNQYTTAFDLSLIAREAMKNEFFRKIIITKSYTIESTNKQPKPRVFHTNNQILLNTKFHVDGADGIKVGYTTEAGHGFVGSATRGDTQLIVVLLHDKKPGLWEDTSSLLKYGFDTYNTIKELSSGTLVTHLKIRGVDSDLPLIAETNFYYTYLKDQLPKIDSNVIIPSITDGAIIKGQKIGHIDYSINGTSIGSVNLIANDDLLATALYTYKQVDDDIKKTYSPWLLIPAILLLIVCTFTILKMLKTKKNSY